MFSKIWSLVILVASWFLVPFEAVRVFHNPDNYWSWFGLTMWVYLMISESVTVFTWSAKEGK